MTSTETQWRIELASCNAALAPYVITIDGGQYVGHDAPSELVAFYGRLCSVGYANGWI